MVSIGCGAESIRNTLEIARANPDHVRVAAGVHPQIGGGVRHVDVRRDRRARARPARRGDRRDRASTSTATTARSTQQDPAFDAQCELARELRQAARHPLARGRGAHDRSARRARRRPRRDPALLRADVEPADLAVVLEHERWVCSFAGNLTYPSAQELRDAAARDPARAAHGRDRRAVPRAEADARQAATSRATCSTRCRCSPTSKGISFDEARAAHDARRPSACSAGRPPRDRRLTDMAQLTLDQLRRFGLTPDTNLGQHFLTDDNVLRVIERMAELGPTTSATSRASASACSPTSSRAACATCTAWRWTAASSRRSTRCAPTWTTSRSTGATRPQLDPATLDPVPTKLVSNLPYHVAAPIVAEALQHAPALRSYCVMVQKEVGERFFAPEGSKGYNALSALLRTTCTRTVARTRCRATCSRRRRTSTRCSSRSTAATTRCSTDARAGLLGVPQAGVPAPPQDARQQPADRRRRAARARRSRRSRRSTCRRPRARSRCRPSGSCGCSSSSPGEADA